MALPVLVVVVVVSEVEPVGAGVKVVLVVVVSFWPPQPATETRAKPATAMASILESRFIIPQSPSGYRSKFPGLYRDVSDERTSRNPREIILMHCEGAKTMPAKPKSITPPAAGELKAVQSD
jgi:hypothetical protein